MNTGPVMAATVTKLNGDLIADVARLYPIRDRVLDPTHGRGLWWTKYRPPELVTHDIAHDGVDFRCLPHPDASFDAVAFDPPYLPQGGRTTSTIPDMLNRFGLVDVPTTPTKLRALIAAGITECHRVVRPGGYVLVKCMNYVSGSRHHPQVHYALTDATATGFNIATQIVHVSGTGPQPRTNLDGTTRRILSPRANYSVLIVLQRPRRTR